MEFRFDRDLFDDFDLYVLSYPCSGLHWNEMVLNAYAARHYEFHKHFHVTGDVQFFRDEATDKPMSFEQLRTALKKIGARCPLYSHDMTADDLRCALALHPDITGETKAVIDRARGQGLLDDEGCDEAVFAKALMCSFQPLSWRRLDWNRAQYRGKKVVLRTRNIKDTMVSFYFHLSRLQGDHRAFRGSISEFLRHEEYGVQRALTFLRIWEENAHIPDRFLHIEYEQLHAEPERTFGKQIDLLLDGPANQNYLREAIAAGSFENMRRLEEEGKIWDPDAKANKDAFKVRAGQVGQYKQHLSAEDIDYIDTLTVEMGNPFSVLGESRAIRPANQGMSRDDRSIQ
jgi:hypothetical protein